MSRRRSSRLKEKGLTPEHSVANVIPVDKPSRKRNRVLLSSNPPRRSPRLNLIIRGELPTELIHEIISIILIEYFDELCTIAINWPRWDAIKTLLQVNHQYRAITAKLVSSLLRIDLNDHGGFVSNPWQPLFHTHRWSVKTRQHPPASETEIFGTMFQDSVEDHPTMQASPILRTYALLLSVDAYIRCREAPADFDLDPRNVISIPYLQTSVGMILPGKFQNAVILQALPQIVSIVIVCTIARVSVIIQRELRSIQAIREEALSGDWTEDTYLSRVDTDVAAWMDIGTKLEDITQNLITVSQAASSLKPYPDSVIQSLQIDQVNLLIDDLTELEDRAFGFRKVWRNFLLPVLPLGNHTYILPET